MNFPKRLTVFLIKIYQKTISFDHGLFRIFYPNGYCCFHPSCSEYARQAIERFGVVKGGFLATSRLLRCNPWSRGGVDEVPGEQRGAFGNPEEESKEGRDLSDQDFIRIADLYRKQVSIPNNKFFKPFLLYPIGLVGSGKTTVIKPMAEYFGLVRISNDEIRKLLNDQGFNLIRTKEISFGLIKEFVKKGFGVAIDADCVSKVKTITEFSDKEKIKVFLIHINTPEDFVLESMKKFRKNAENFIEIYHKRKPLHEKLDFDFVYTFDTSRSDLSEQIVECEKIIEGKIRE